MDLTVERATRIRDQLSDVATEHHLEDETVAQLNGLLTSIIAGQKVKIPKRFWSILLTTY